jgi:hypothetical protein
MGLKEAFRIFRVLILDSSVEGGRPSFAAAPVTPETLPSLCASAVSMSLFLRPEVFPKAPLMKFRVER